MMKARLTCERTHRSAFRSTSLFFLLGMEKDAKHVDSANETPTP